MITEIFKVFYQSSTDLIESLGEIMGEAEGFTMVDDEKNNQIIGHWNICTIKSSREYFK